MASTFPCDDGVRDAGATGHKPWIATGTEIRCRKCGKKIDADFNAVAE